MKCPYCAEEINADDLKCRFCGEVIEAHLEGRRKDINKWFYISKGEQVGPIDEEIIKGKISSGEIQGNTQVWKEGMSEWIPINQTQLFHYLSTTKSVPPPIPEPKSQLFFPVSKTKLVVMFVFTFGLYELYWVYKNWKFLKETQGLNILPFWRTFFYPIFCYSLFKRIREYAKENNVRAKYSPGWLTTGYILLMVMQWGLNPFWWVSFLRVLAFFPARSTIDALNTKTIQTKKINAQFSKWNIIAIIIGTLLWGLTIIIPDGILLRTSEFLQNLEGKAEKLEFNGGEIYYTSNVTRNDTERLGKYLVENKFFDGNRRTVNLSKSGSIYECRMVIKKGIENDQEYIQGMKLFAQELSQEVFNGNEVDIHLCDEYLKTLRVVIGLSIKDGEVSTEKQSVSNDSIKVDINELITKFNNCVAGAIVYGAFNTFGTTLWRLIIETNLFMDGEGKEIKSQVKVKDDQVSIHLITETGNMMFNFVIEGEYAILVSSSSMGQQLDPMDASIILTGLRESIRLSNLTEKEIKNATEKAKKSLEYTNQ